MSTEPTLVDEDGEPTWANLIVVSRQRHGIICPDQYEPAKPSLWKRVWDWLWEEDPE